MRIERSTLPLYFLLRLRTGMRVVKEEVWRDGKNGELHVDWGEMWKYVFSGHTRPGLCASRESITPVLRALQNRFWEKKKTPFCRLLRNINPGLGVTAKEGYREGEEENQGCFLFSTVFGHVIFFPRPIWPGPLLDHFWIWHNGYSSKSFYLQAIAKITNNHFKRNVTLSVKKHETQDTYTCNTRPD